MGKMRVRSKNRKRGVRWAKGQSSSSNPEKTRHRDAARTRSALSLGASSSHLDLDLGPSRLTAETLLRHDVLLGRAGREGGGAGGAGGGVEEEEDGFSLGSGRTGKTFRTFASDWTNCQNVSFSKLTSLFDPNKPGQLEMLAVLGAVTDVIRERGGEETDVNYFAALLTTLEETAARGSAEEQRPILGLLGMVVKRVPRELLQNKFPEVSKLFYDLLTAQVSSAETDSYVTRALVGCLSVLLRAQSYRTWTEESTKRMYQGILALSVHPRPKVRRAAQHAVCAILGNSLVTEVALEEEEGEQCQRDLLHPVAKLTAEECLRRLKLGQEVNVALHTLVLLKEVLQYAPEEQVRKVCEATLSLMQGKTHAHMSLCGMRLLHGLFSSRPPPHTLSWRLNAQLVNALYDHRPSVNDPGPSVAWLTVMQEALLNLFRVGADEPRACLVNAATFFGEAKHGWASDRKEVAVATTAAMRAILGECLAPQAEAYAETEMGTLEKLFSHVLDGMGYQYHASWGHVLAVMSDLFAAAGPSCSRQLCRFLPLLADRRTGDNFYFTNELDYAFGKAIRTFGPRSVLSAVPLGITGGEGESLSFPRSWLLPVLRENVQRSELAFFVEYFLPLAEALREAGNRRANRDDHVGRKMYQLLETQVWALLPGFCNGPVDLASALKTSVGGKVFAQVMGEVLVKRKDAVRSHVLAAVRQLVAKSQAFNRPGDVEAMAKKAKNFLPLLCNIYTSKPQGSEETNQRMAVYATLCEYAKIAPEDNIKEMFSAAFRNYEGPASHDAFLKEATMDILKAYLPYQDEDNLRKLYDEATRLLESQDHTVQKKAYRLVEELCRSERPACMRFVQHLVCLPQGDDASLRKVFLSSLSKASPSSQASRLRSLIIIMQRLAATEGSDEYFRFAKDILPEAILCIRSLNKKARDSSVELIKSIGNALLAWGRRGDGDGTEEASVDQFIQLLSAGLGGDATLIRCSLLALASAIFEFADFVPDATMERLLDNVVALATCSSREVVGSCLSFVTVFVQVNPVFKTGRKDILDKIVGCIVSMNEDCKRFHRQQTQRLLTRLLRKFGHDMISALVPKEDEVMHKRLKNIHKEQARKQRNREKRLSARQDEDDEEDDLETLNKRKSLKAQTMDEILRGDSDESDEEMGEEEERKQRKKRNSRQTFIVENKRENRGGGEEEAEGIIDFLDPSAAQQVTSRRPQERNQIQEKEKRKEKNGGFEVGTDGRLIIRDDDDDDDEEDGAEEDEDDDDDVDGENTFKALVSSRKRKRAGGSVSSGTTWRRGKATSVATGERPMKYQAGGSGIHRPVGKKSEEAAAPGSEYRSSKASGDVKRKGRPDPYAYLPLQKSALNKRKRQKFEGQFKSVVRSAKQGAAKGARNRGKEGRRKNVASDMRRLSL